MNYEDQKIKREYKRRSTQERLDQWMKKIQKWEAMEQKRILKIGRARQIAQHLQNDLSTAPETPQHD